MKSKTKQRTANRTPKSAEDTIESQEVLTHLRRAKVMELRKGDVLVVTVPKQRFRDLHKNIHSVCTKIFPGQKVIIKAKDITLKVVRKK